jgi:Ca-activated chloride channel homolog
VNGGFLRRLSALGGGTSTLVEPGTRLEEALQAVGREIGTPLVTGLRIEGEAAEMAPARMPDLFAGRASSVFFRFGGRRLKVMGQLAGGGRFEQEVEAREAPLAAIEHLWARARIADLEDEFRGSQSELAKKEIVALSIRHTVLTRLTAFVVADEEVVNKGGGRRTVVQPVAMPAGWETRTLGVPAVGPMLKMPFHGPLRGPGPVRAMGGMPEVTAQASQATFGRRMMENLLNRPMREEPATPAQREAVRQAFEAFLRAFSAAKSGTGGAEDLERSRIALLEALAASLAIAVAVPLLQAFLRGAAVEVVAAMPAGAADSALLDHHARALEAARNEARPVLGDAGATTGNFWEASI